MRKIIFLCLSLLVNLLGVMAQNDAMIVYQNNGIINAFLKADVDSMRCSHIGLDSVEYADYVVQEVWTVDSVYRIPLEVIDSVSFITPPTIYKDRVVNLKKQLLDYVIGADGLTLKLKTNVPKLLIPSVGDKLVMVDGCETLPYGFSGVVSSIQAVDGHLNVYCEHAYLEDLFDSFCSVTTAYGIVGDDGGKKMFLSKSGTKQRAVNASNDATFRIETLTVDCPAEFSSSVLPNSDLVINGATECSVSISPTFRIHTFLLVSKEHGVYFNGSITGNVEVASKFSAYGSICYSHDFEKKNGEVSFSVPFTANLVKFYVVPGMFVHADATIAETVNEIRNYTFGMAFDYSSRGENILKPLIETPRLVSSNTDVTGSIDGSLAVGGFIETGLKLMSRDFVKANARGELGWKVKGDFVLRNSDVDAAEIHTKLYERLKSSSVETGPFATFSLEVSTLGGVLEKSTTLASAELVKKWDIVPTFSKVDLSHTIGSFTTLTACSEVFGNCLFPVTIGYKLYDESMNEIADFNAENKFKNGECVLKHIFSNLDIDKRYTVFPKVKFLGIDVLSSPKVDASFELPTIKEFSLADSVFLKDGFSYEGYTYDYKFDVTFVAEINSLKGIEDWGYVYRDSNGKAKVVSLMQFGQSYADVQFSYYQNQAKTAINICCYVKYSGDSEYYYTKSTNYPVIYVWTFKGCPDSNHPHAIDLGLPSGTKWSCCNVGASVPENFGGYYAWGEVHEKEQYLEKTYKYRLKDGNYVDIGSNIANTEYDVAHLIMGAKWCMPSVEQIEELRHYCSTNSILVNGVKGILLKAQNSHELFLPAAGYCDRNGNNTIGIYSYYWSSESHVSDSLAYFLESNFEGTGRIDYASWNRFRGLPVRAVCF